MANEAKLILSKEMAVPNGSFQAISASQHLVKSIIISPEFGKVAIRPIGSSDAFSVLGKVDDGASMTIDLTSSGQEVDLAKLEVGAELDGVTLQVWVFD